MYGCKWLLFSDIRKSKRGHKCVKNILNVTCFCSMFPFGSKQHIQVLSIKIFNNDRYNKMSKFLEMSKFCNLQLYLEESTKIATQIEQETCHQQLENLVGKGNNACY